MIYFDHAATTPLDPNALAAMRPFLETLYGNPSSPYSLGREAHGALELARERVAGTLHADPKEIVFTSGGTESVNLALKGAAWALKDKGSHFVVSSVEHRCVLDAVDWLSHRGFQVTEVPVDSVGRVDPKEVEKALRRETILIAVMAANNETGTLQPVREIGALARSRGVLFFSDAVQAYGKIDLNMEKDPVDLLAVSGHKIHGPKGSGFLYQRRGTPLVPLMHGGGQERGRRGGTENTAAIVGLAEAAARICRCKDSERARLKDLTDLLWTGLKKRIPEIELNGPVAAEERVPGFLNLRLPGLEGETLVLSLDAKGFAASTGAACATGGAEPSHVLTAMGRRGPAAREVLRLSLGAQNTEVEVRELLEVLPLVAERLKAMSGLWLEDGRNP